MKKLYVFLGAIGVLALLVSGAWADGFTLTPGGAVTANEITVYDGHGSGTGWNGGQEFQEVEPGATTGDTWDYRGMWFDLASKKLYVMSGFDPTKGGYYYNYPTNSATFPTGDLFIKIGSTQPKFALDGIFDGVNYVANGAYTPDNTGYDYAIDMNGKIYTLDKDSLLQQATNPSALGKANPWIVHTFVSDTETTTVTTGKVSNITGTSNIVDGDWFTCYDLGFLSTAELGQLYAHLSYQCGNDGVVGGEVGGEKVPIPGSLLLFGTGLIGLGALRRRIGIF